MDQKVVLAEIEDMNSILKLYQDRMEWFRDNGIKQWSRYLQNHPKEEFEKAINDRNFYIVKSGDELVASFEISSDSGYWDDNTATVYYLYKIVTKVGHKNLGKIIFNKCRELAKRNGKECLRLICLKSNKKLNDIYEKHGFKLVGYGNNGRWSYCLRELKVDE